MTTKTTATRLADEFKDSPRYRKILAVFAAVDKLEDDEPLSKVMALLGRTTPDLNGEERYRLPAFNVDDMQHPPFEGLVEAEGQRGKDQAQDRQRAPQPHAKSFFLWRFCHSRTASASWL